jgi:hypothetical protein
LSPNDSAAPRAVPSSPVAGATMILSAVVAVAAVAHHPSVGRAASGADVLAQIVRLSALDESVHAVVIVAACGLLFGLTAFAARRGLRNEAVLAGLIAYATGTVFAIAAALIDGFLIPAIAARYATAPPARLDTALQLLTVCAMTIQIATKTWLLATCFAVLMWSSGLIRHGRVLRAIGALGAVATAALLVVLAFTANVNPHSLGLIVVLQTVWYVAIGALMVRGEL